MKDIDDAFAQIRALPIDPRLASIDAAVMAGVQSRMVRNPLLPSIAFCLAAIGSLTVGIVGATIPSVPAHTSTSFPFGAPTTLAPSTLLSGTE